MAASLTGLARVLAAKDPDGARPLLDRALAIRERRMLPNHLDIAATLLARGDLERAAGRASAAEAAYRQALSLYDASAPKHRDRETARRGLEAAGTRSSPAAVAAKLMDAWNAYDSDRAKALYTPDAVTVRRETRAPVNHDASRGYRAYEAVTAARFRYTVLETTDRHVEIEFTEDTDFLRAIGIDGVTARWRYVVEGGLIREEHHLNRPAPALVAALRAFDDWVAAERPARSPEIRHPNGDLRFDGASAPVLLALAREWEAAGRPGASSTQ